VRLVDVVGEQETPGAAWPFGIGSVLLLTRWICFTRLSNGTRSHHAA
jgi:hypothetical protein